MFLQSALHYSAATLLDQMNRDGLSRPTDFIVIISLLRKKLRKRHHMNKKSPVHDCRSTSRKRHNSFAEGGTPQV